MSTRRMSARHRNANVGVDENASSASVVPTPIPPPLVHTESDAPTTSMEESKTDETTTTQTYSPKRHRGKKRLSRVDRDASASPVAGEDVAAAAAAAPAAVPTAVPCEASSSVNTIPVTHRRTSRQAANPKLAVTSYAEIKGDEEDEEEESNGHRVVDGESSDQQNEDMVDIEVADDASDDKSLNDEDEYMQSDSDVDDEEEDATCDDEDEFTLETDQKRKKRKSTTKKKMTPTKSTRKRKSTTSNNSSSKKPKSTPQSSQAQTVVVDLDSIDADDLIHVDTPPSTSKKPTAASRRKSIPTHIPKDPLQEERDAAFRAFATAPVEPIRVRRDVQPPPAAAPVNYDRPHPPPASSTAGSARDDAICIDDEDIQEIAPFAPSNSHRRNNHHPHSSSASTWSAIGLSSASTPGVGSKKAPAKSKSVNSSISDREEKANLVSELLGGPAYVTRGDVMRYLENADWNAELAVGRIMDSAWYRSNGNGSAATTSSANQTSKLNSKRVTGAIAGKDTPAAASTSATHRTARPAIPASIPVETKRPSTVTARNDPSSPSFIDDSLPAPSLLSARAPPVAPVWSRRLLLILNVSALSTTSGKGILSIGDEVEFKREKFDPIGWSETNKATQEEADRIANEKAIAASSAGGAKKKSTATKGKKTAAPTNNLFKKPTRILRFKRKDAPANSLEIGSVPAILTTLLAPLFDANFIELDSSVLYVPPVLDYYTTITLSLSVYVLPSLFMWRTPIDVSLGSAESRNPFWRKIFAGKESNGGGGAIWNPIEAFCKLMRECEVKPIASTEMELDDNIQDTKQNDAISVAGHPAKPNDAETDPQAASTSSTAVPSSDPVYEEELSLNVAPSSVDGVAADSATISRFQLESLYASAAVATKEIPESDAPIGLRAVLRPYQKQALYWMKQRESTTDHLPDVMPPNSIGESAKPPSTARRHALWDEYAFADAEESRFFVNPFSNEISLEFPASTGSCRGGLLCDEMGQGHTMGTRMGKTVMCCALIVANHPANLILDRDEDEKDDDEKEKNKQEDMKDDGTEKETTCVNNDGDIQVVPSATTATAAVAASSSSSPTPASSSSPPAASIFESLHSTRLRHRRKYMHHDGVSGCTLVVCPMSLLSQWRDEISRFTDLDTLVYYGNGKDRRKVNFEEFDVIITSYGVLAAEYRALMQAQQAANEKATQSGHTQATLTDRQIANISSIMATNFWRIILDEAHIIRNRSTETAKAVFHLRGIRRWAVSGTIIQNKLDDVFAPLLFLREEPWSSWGWWSTVISQPFERQEEIALQRLRAILAPLMLRRTKAMRTATGESIVELPPRIDETLHCEFSPEERDFYTALYERSKTQFEGFVSAGTVTSKYIQVLTLLLRLRQCADHPFLVLGHTKSDGDFESDINRFIHRFVSRVDLHADGAPTMEFLQTLTNDLKKEDKQDCAICLSPTEIPVLTECIQPLFNSRGLARCPLCRGVIDRARLFLVPDPNPATRIDAAKQWKHSSKTLRLLEELRKIRDGSDPNAKVIIFSQWTAMLDLVEIPLGHEKMPFLRLDGAMTQKERESVLQRFGSIDSPQRILLVSLKAGGTGLNLVMANYVFFLDCWWNPSVEEQAIQRIHRIGQTKVSYVKRFIVTGSVEERILELQEKKKFLAQSVTSDAEEQKQMRMQDLVQLFKEV